MARDGTPPSEGATATYVRPATQRPPPLAAVVRVEGAPARPDRFVLREGVCVIGSAPACDMVIDEPTVSRMHAELQLLPEGVGVRDLGSR
ncbi:MAG: FHA domain-containing protein, partial [Polyangiaceae bacterium]